jgi:hypothetical protein
MSNEQPADTAEHTVEVTHSDRDDYLILEKVPGEQRILAVCPYLAYAEHVAAALRARGPYVLPEHP